jgi:hypothetical protein
MSFDPNDIYNKVVVLGEKWADAEAAAQILEESRKSVRAQIAMKEIALGVAVNKSELTAEASNEYGEHIKKMVEARRQANIAKVNYTNAQVWVELKRTEAANRRAETRL